MSLLPVAYIHSQSARLPQAVVDQNCSISSIQLRHLNSIPSFITPVQVSSHPVDCQAVWVAEWCAVKNLTNEQAVFIFWKWMRVFGFHCTCNLHEHIHHFEYSLHFWQLLTAHFISLPLPRRFYADLNIAAIDVHASNHAALGGHICPINHLLAIVEV